MYEVTLTRLLSVTTWYYLAFVAVSMAMFGMTVGALAVKLRPEQFREDQVPLRMAQVSWAMAAAMPLSLLTMLAVPIDLSLSLQTLYSFLLFSAIISVPFVFAGVAVCLALTRSPFPVGRVYFVDLLGAASGCFGAVGLLKLLDAPSAIFAISGLTFLAAAACSNYAGQTHARKWSLFAVAMFIIAGLNARTLYGIQPIWSKGEIDKRTGILTEAWNAISRVRVYQPDVGRPMMWGASSNMPDTSVESILIEIDSAAATTITRYHGDPRELAFLRYDVTSLAAQLRKGGQAAIIGVGGGRDLLTARANDFARIVGIEVNPSILDVTARRLDWFSGFSKIPGLELHVDEGRSYLTRSAQKFDVIQASLVDTWAATSAGAMTLTENSLYTVEGWRIFYEHLRPGGLISFTRWNKGDEAYETDRMFSLAWAVLLSEGVTNPGSHMALIGSDEVATLLLSNQPLSAEDLDRLRSIAEGMDFELLFFPGEETSDAALRRIVEARTLEDLARLRDSGSFDLSPVYDSSPFFFNALRLRSFSQALLHLETSGNLEALAFLFAFTLAAVLLVTLTILVPLAWHGAPRNSASGVLAGGIAYFIAIGLGFMLAEIAMMQQLSLFLGHPVYSLVVVLAGLISFAGLGSLASEQLQLASGLASHAPALASSVVLVVYASLVIPAIHHYIGGAFWLRVALCLALIGPCGFLMGFCFPVGLRWLAMQKQKENLPWMWALNGAASVLASFVAVVISMELSITICVLAGAACYLVGAAMLPTWNRAQVLEVGRGTKAS